MIHPGLPWIWISMDIPWIYPCVDIRLMPRLHQRNKLRWCKRGIRLYCGYIHGYCTMYSAEMYARQRSFQRLLGQLLPASSKNVVQKAIKLFVRHATTAFRHVRTLSRSATDSVTTGVERLLSVSVVLIVRRLVSSLAGWQIAPQR